VSYSTDVTIIIDPWSEHPDLPTSFGGPIIGRGRQGQYTADVKNEDVPNIVKQFLSEKDLGRITIWKKDLGGRIFNNISHIPPYRQAEGTKTCDKCNGSGSIPCDKCNGSGSIP
jgi:hypothetical protein